MQRDRAFLSAWGTAPIGAVTLFKGRVSTVDSVGRTTAQMTVACDLVLLDIDMPRNLYQPTCNHVLFDSGCGLVKNAFGAAGTVGAGRHGDAGAVGCGLGRLRARHNHLHVGRQHGCDRQHQERPRPAR